MKNRNKPQPQPPSAGHTERAFNHAMINRLNNAICLLIAAAVFAMIGIDSGNQPGMTHSGTQRVVKVQR